MKRNFALGLALLLLCACAAGLGESDTIITLVKAPEQTQPERPPCFPDPSEQYVPLPDTENLAQGQPVESGEHTDVYVVANVNDGQTDTYWESKGFPAELTVDLGEAHAVTTVAVCLNPSSVWEARKQEFAVLVSADGEDFAEVAPKTIYDFDPATGNRVRVDLEPVQARYVRLVFTLNSASRTGGAQAAEVCVY